MHNTNQLQNRILEHLLTIHTMELVQKLSKALLAA